MYLNDSSTLLASPVPMLAPPDLGSAHIGGLEVKWAESEEDVREAQQLRFMVFAKENGAREVESKAAGTGREVDRFDAYCDHLMVRAVAHGPQGGPQEGRGPLVGTYRLLGPQAAVRAGGLYGETEFDMTPLASLKSRAVELGRSCVHPSWRSGSVIMVLWTALCQYMRAHRLETMIGCASIAVNDGHAAAASLWHQLRHDFMAAPCWHVTPRIALPVGAGADPSAGRRGGNPLNGAPPLVKGYLRCGARLLGPPALDTVFNTADLPMMLNIGDLTQRYRRHFFRE